MFVPLARSLILIVCTGSAFVVLGRAPGAVNLRTRDIETAITAEGKQGRDRKAGVSWPSGAKPM